MFGVIALHSCWFLQLVLFLNGDRFKYVFKLFGTLPWNLCGLMTASTSRALWK